MRIDVSKFTAALALTACTMLAGQPAALASTGGAAAPASGTAAGASATHKARTSSIATWFGPGFFGKKTACGQTLTPSVVGVANRTLPCGTLVKVAWHGHTLTVPVLDRGPYSHGADWDLTAGAAEALGITETVRIQTRIVGRVANSPQLGTPPAPPAPAAAAKAGGAAAS